MLKIGDFSKLAQVSVKTLRYYAELGLLKPAWIDRFTSYRYYAPEQLPRLNRILALKDLGFSLDQITLLLRKELPADQLRGMLRMKAAELEQLVQAEQARLARIEARLQQIDQEGTLPDYEVVLKPVAQQRILGLRQTVPVYGGIFELFQRLSAHLSVHAVESDEAHPYLIIYYDQEYREQSVDVEVAVMLEHPIPAGPGMRVWTLPAVETAACVVHHGRLRDLSRAYSAMLTWIERNSYRITGPNCEIYLRGPETASAQAEVIVEVLFPVEHKSVSSYIAQLEKEKVKMQPMIVTKPAFSVVGLKYRGKNENNEIAAMWDVANARAPEIVAAAEGLGAAYGICRDMEADGIFEYLACLEIKDIREIPEGMERWDVPEQTYAVFPCKLGTIGEAYRYAFQEWLPASGYQRGDGPDFEYYDYTFDPNDAENSQLYVYIPVVKA